MLTSAEEEFNNQIDMMTHYVASQLLFPAIFAILPSGPMNKMVMVAEMGVMHGVNSMEFHSPGLTWLQLQLSDKSANSKDQPESPT